ncbi:di/tricarboxylate transporter [Limnobacter thiooxidans]|uniref:SLC13 family permease n=1 Tax=Limnobacter thiooxidans TaxID=131080 RepID=A0AA86IZE2_9BURK|nr:di/tricarboxylate transporter [Limnobacter thiooxidans]BET24758.1 SLC13 family permease [Limnobacter thiooxidans]
MITSGLVLTSVFVLLVLLVRGVAQPATLFGLFSIGFFFAGLIEQTEFLSSYTNPAMICVLLLILTGLVLERSALITQMSKVFLSGSTKASVFKLSIMTSLFSAFVSNTAVVAALLPAVSKQSKIDPSKLLIPLSYASILGGVTTLIGTSTNLLVYSLAESQGITGINLFTFTGVGLILVVAGCALMSLTTTEDNTGTHAADKPIEVDGNPQGYFLESKVKAGSSLVGKSVIDNGLRGLEGLFLLEIVREDRLISPVRPDEIVQTNDRLIFVGETHRIQTLQHFDGLEVFGSSAGELLESNLVEVVIANQSELVNKTPREVDFRTLFDAAVVGIRRGDKKLTGQLGRIELRVGDSLILAVGADFKNHKNLERNFHLLTDEPLQPKLSRKDNWLTLGGLALAIGLASTGVISLLQGLMAFVLFLVGMKLLPAGQMRRRFPFDLWILIGSALVIADVMTSSGAAKLIADYTSSVLSPFGVMGAFVSVYLMTWLLTELVTNSAAAALAFPIAVSSAAQYDAAALPFVLAVAFAASSGFLIPTGYQTHMMVMSPGRYRTMDFIRKGTPMAILYGLICVVFIPLFFPF